MLSTKSGGTGQPPTDADSAATITTASSTAIGRKIEGIECLKTIKIQSEPLSILSLENVSNNTQIQTMSDETSVLVKSGNNSNNNNSNNNNKNNNNTTNSNTSGSLETGITSGAVSATCAVSKVNVLRHNSTGNITSEHNISSTHNGSDNSNTNSNSSNASTSVALVAIADNELIQENISKKNKEDESAPTHTISSRNVALDKINENSIAAAICSTNIGSAPSDASSIKEEPSDALANFTNMKKEEHFSPNMSPVGFASIGGQSSGVPDRSVTPVKMELNSNSTDKPLSDTVLNTDDIVGCNSMDADRMGEPTSCNSNMTRGSSGNGGAAPVNSGPASALGLGVSVGVGIGINTSPNASTLMVGNSASNALGNCFDYMQQQNHIFVFSTQLANKGAESVLSGQFQTIIAYHCTQPATKSFLEDFLMKNPMKMNKLQRQNPLGLNNICNMPGPGGQAWQTLNTNTSNSPILNLNQNPVPNQNKALQLPQKVGGGVSKSHFNNHSIKRNSFADSTSAEPIVNESDLMCWETGNISSNVNRNNLEVGIGVSDSRALKIMESVDSVVNNVGKCSSDITSDTNIVSLQGVKVPDENLTPQQRQHREEQLAKLKKMNQFLFPENDNAGNQLNKSDSALTNIMMNIPDTSNTKMRQMQMQVAQKSDHAPVQLSDEVLMPLSTEVMGEIRAVIPCNSVSKSSLPCGTAPAPIAGPGVGSGSGIINLNINVGMQCPGTPNASNIINDSPDMISNFGNTNDNVIGMGVGDKNVMNTQDSISISQDNITQMDWTKIQQQFFEERIKGSKVSGRPSGISSSAQGLISGPSPGSTVQQPSIGAGSGSAGSGPIVNQSNSLMRNNVHGPPPPYHPTQRSASVPINTQSPNPSSPNNHSLPSPRTSGTLALPSNSPSMELAITNTSANVSTTASIGGIQSSKTCFQPDGGSPSNRQRVGANSMNVMHHHLNSNPSTPLSNLSPKELEPFNQSGGDFKSTRPGPQQAHSPGIVNNNPTSGSLLIEPNNIDSRFPASSPVQNFNSHTHLPSNPNMGMNSYKGPNGNNTMERQNCGSSTPMQFARRSDNMPLNPNCNNRSAPNKMSQNFDPISSLAQMSQQLTSCVSGVVSPAGGMNIMGTGPGSTDMNIDHGGILSGLDATGIDNINHTAVGNTTNSCHPISPMMNSMGQRILNPKLCGLGTGFNHGPNGVIRDGPGPVSVSSPGPSFHGILPPPARVISRLPVNFGPNFNPNIQVKASTPNTIQYMPVRAQNNNNANNNVRMPPSLEFLQRYAHPQMTGTGSGVPPIAHAIGNEPLMIGPGPINMNSLNEQQQQSKMGNNASGNNNGIGMNFFQNCNQLSGFEDDSSVGGGLSGHEMSVGHGTMIRGMRPHGLRQNGGLSSRLPVSGGNIVNRQSQFTLNSDGIDCTDPNLIYNNVPGACNNISAMFAASHQGQQKQQHLKPMSTGMCQNQGDANVSIAGPTTVQVHVQGQGNPILGGPNNSNLMSSGSGGTTGVPGTTVGVGVNFVGPSSNDLKYAQQYHSFQQQLYATNTRNHQQQHHNNSAMITVPPNLSPNPAFYVNK